MTEGELDALDAQWRAMVLELLGTIACQMSFGNRRLKDAASELAKKYEQLAEGVK